MAYEMAEETTRGQVLRQVVAAIGQPEHSVVKVTWRQHSNDVGRIELDDGRVLMVKLARFRWAAPGFEAERQAARLLQDRDVVVPHHLPIPDMVAGRPVLCYWRIELETKASIWPRLNGEAQRRVLRTWGGLLRRVHEVDLDSVGRLGEGKDEPLEHFLGRDVGHRLGPAVAGEWPAGYDSLKTALATLPELERRVGDQPRVLLHGDPHARNVMCTGYAATCDGFIDLEGAGGGPREMDLANLVVLHGPHFDQPLPEDWFREVQAGYGLELDPFAMDWFALYHLLNLGFFSAHVGHAEHAAAVAASAADRAESLRRRTNGTAPAT